MTMFAAWSRPQHVAAFAAALLALQPEDSDAIVHTALDRVWEQLNDGHPTDQAIIILLHIISCLEEDHRQYGTRLILT
jgi:hypothetical protein